MFASLRKYKPSLPARSFPPHAAPPSHGEGGRTRPESPEMRLSKRRDHGVDSGKPMVEKYKPDVPNNYDPNVDLISSLLSASSNSLLRAAVSAREALGGGLSRAMRLIEPPPEGFPPGPSGDQAFNLLQDPLRFLDSMTDQHGPVVGLLMGTERVVLVTGREAARQVMVDQADVFVKQGTAFFPGSALTGSGLLVSDGEVWRRQRRLSNPAFRKSTIDGYANAMVSCTQDLLRRRWVSGRIYDVYADFNTLTLEITLEALFGFTLNPGSRSSADGSPLTEPSSTSDYRAIQILQAVEKAFEFFTKRAGSALVLPEWVPTLDNLEFGQAVQQLDKVIYSIIDERRRELEGGVDVPRPSARTDLLQSLLTAVDDGGQGMSDQSLRDELMTMLVAGQETSAILLGWTCALLAHHPQVQQRVAEEVDRVLQNRPPQASDIRELKYTEAVLLEALRLYAPAYLVGRCANRDVQLGSYTLGSGTTVLISPYVMHRSREYWLDADHFNPDRWVEVQQRPGYAGFMSLMSNVGEAVNGAYVPFGAGPRNCIGTGFAMMEAILVVASVVQQYMLRPSNPGAAFPLPKPLITLRPESVPLLITRR